jgi:DNA modification methylase
MTVEILIGDNRETLKTLPDKSVQCCITSPPYFGLRSYLPEGHDDKDKEIGLEQTPEQFVQELVVVFQEIKRIFT